MSMSLKVSTRKFIPLWEVDPKLPGRLLPNRDSQAAKPHPVRAGDRANPFKNGAGNGIRTRDPQLGRLTL